MSCEVHVRFCEGVGVKFPRATHLVVLCRSEEQARQAWEKIQEFAKANGLRLHPKKTQIANAREPGGFDFLGYHFERGLKWPRKKSMAKLKEALRAKTRRTQGRSLKAICADLNRVLQGWFEYFKHSKSTVFETVDGYTRGRLRSILRKRRGRKGRGGGRDHQRWPNAFFHAQGLISLSQSLQALRQSP
jgi:RNA-directed DNA polymerase